MLLRFAFDLIRHALCLLGGVANQFASFFLDFPCKVFGRAFDLVVVEIDSRFVSRTLDCRTELASACGSHNHALCRHAETIEKSASNLCACQHSRVRQRTDAALPDAHPGLPYDVGGFRWTYRLAALAYVVLLSIAQHSKSLKASSP